jgi:acetoin:2,6-dichlorophenolindophenol oxidoreductase subunit beta
MSLQTEPLQPSNAESGMRELTYREAVRAALEDEMTSDDRVVLLGEDVGAAGGPFKTEEGLIDRFGPTRVIETPICENGFMSVGLGLSVTGFRPVVEISFSDFLPTAADSLVNETAKFRFMSGGQLAVPLTVRVIGGATVRFGAQHSATGESWFMHVAGLRIAAAASPGAAYGLLCTAIRENNPVLVFEHKALYGRKGPVDRNGTLPPIGRASVVRAGSDVTIVATLLMVERSMLAAAQLLQEGVDTEVIDLTWISPLDIATVEASIRKTGRLVVVEEQPHAGGWGATLISELTIRGIPWESAPIAVSLPPQMPIPYSPPLEDLVVPSVDRIVSATRSAMSNSKRTASLEKSVSAPDRRGS